MYKTVRQGENSLQYTILPQSEEVFSNSGVKGKGRDYSPSNQPSKRSRTRLNETHLIYILISSLLCIGVTLLLFRHFGVPTDFIPKNFTQRFFAFKSENKTDLVTSTTTISSSFSPSTLPPTTTTTVAGSTKAAFITTNKIIESISMGNEIQSTTTPKQETSTVSFKSTVPPRRESNNDLMLDRGQINWTDYQDEDDDDDDDYDVNKSVSNSTDTKKASNKVSTVKTVTVSPIPQNPTSTVKNIKKAKGKQRNRTNKLLETKESILDDNEEVFKEFNSDSDDASRKDDIKMSQTKSWLQNKWPFVDASSYFQWTGYNARDNLLLPAILSAVLSALFVLTILCYAMRRRQRCKRRIQEIGNLTSDLQAEDNAILLTAENPSEEE